VALARVGGGMDELTAPLGRKAGTLLAVAVYLAIGPLFATPRTAVVSFEMGVAPFTGNEPLPLALYSAAYFAAVLFLALNPGKLVDSIGKFITPVLLAALLVLGIVIATAIKDRGVRDSSLVTRYSVIAGIIAATGLSLVYLALFYLGATSQGIAGDAQNGVQILTTYVQHTFGTYGSLLLAVVITLACLTTAVGLLTACGEYFSKLLPFSYKTMVLVFGLFSLVVSNQGLTQLISVSVPVLVGLSLLGSFWCSAPRVFVPTMTVTLVFGLADALNAAGFSSLVPNVFAHLPMAAEGLGWLVPVAVTLLVAAVFDRLRGEAATRTA
jgi:LIVCS family branched-chain amino acid:cation transporter